MKRRLSCLKLFKTMAEFSESRLPVGSSASNESPGGVTTGARQGYALLARRGKFQRLVMHLVFESQQAQNFAPVSGIVVAVGVECVRPGRRFPSAVRVGEENEALEYKPILRRANVGPLGVRSRGQVFSGRSRCGPFVGRQQTAEQVQHR